MSTKTWLQRKNGWAAWGIVCALVLAGVAMTAGGAAVHSPRYDGSSVATGALITTGVLLALSAIGAFFDAFIES